MKQGILPRNHLPVKAVIGVMGAAVRQAVLGWMFCTSLVRHAISVFHRIFAWAGPLS